MLFPAMIFGNDLWTRLVGGEHSDHALQPIQRTQIAAASAAAMAEAVIAAAAMAAAINATGVLRTRQQLDLAQLPLSGLIPV
jgi:hypothetical protein